MTDEQRRKLETLTIELDGIQFAIDKCRKIAPTDLMFQQELDERERDVKAHRALIKAIKDRA